MGIFEWTLKLNQFLQFEAIEAEKGFKEILSYALFCHAINWFKNVSIKEILYVLI